MTFHIQRATLADFGGLFQAQRKIAQEAEHLAITQKDKKASMFQAFLKAIMNRNRVHTLIAKDNGGIVGYITIVTGKFLKVRGTAYVVMGVVSTHRSQGIGTQLLAAAEAFIHARGMHRIELEVFEKNERAVKLYERAGFIMEGRRREAVKTADGYDDIIWMGKLLS